MDSANPNALFRAHATARLRRDTAEAARLAAQIGPERHMAHTVFVLSVFMVIVAEELGDRPDPWDLAELTKRLHDKHFEANPGFNALRAEAMVRAVCTETGLLNEIPLAEQPGYMWAVMTELIDLARSDADLAELFEAADIARADWVNESAARSLFTGMGVAAPVKAAAPQDQRVTDERATDEPEKERA